MDYIEFSSFSSIWYWLGLLVVWSAATHRTLGVPFYYWILARRGDDYMRYYLEQLVPENAQLTLRMYQGASWVVFAASASFLVTTWAVLAFYYQSEILQALFFLLVPLSGVAVIRYQFARVIVRTNPQFDDLFRVMYRFRIYTMILAAAIIFLTTFWGMWVNMVNSGILSFRILP